MDEVLRSLSAMSELYEQFAFRSTSLNAWFHYRQAYVDNELYIENVIGASKDRGGISDNDASVIIAIAKDSLANTLATEPESEYA